MTETQRNNGFSLCVSVYMCGMIIFWKKTFFMNKKHVNICI
jgi:hypothetical protein